ncbi:unnamed protein product [Adineta ricciae]|uniref:SH3 domain-binding protein 5-like protein n=1 Tax=Adineta ricciae TaxID=249248 RepID=A0A815TJ89_ADIRI|nr:unnamed protein product [Adineta ricciae]
MSDSSKIIDHEQNDDPLDPRIQIELERANAATSEINNLETQFENAQKLFQITFTHCKQRLANLAKALGRCVERARPYYDVCKQAHEAQIETQKAAQEYQNSVEFHCTMQENLILTESKLPQADSITRQEYLDHITRQVMQAEQDKIRCERTHAEKSKLYQEYEQQRISLSRSLTKTILKSKPYFDAKVKAENELKTQKLQIEDIQKAISQAKKAYRTALNNLEQISEEIHIQRQNQIPIKLPAREPGVGAEKPDEFIELPTLGKLLPYPTHFLYTSQLTISDLNEFVKIDLSDSSSDSDLSKSASTTCMNSSSNKQLFKTNSPRLASNTSNSLTSHASARHKSGKVKSPRMTRNNETPLLSHLFGTQKFHSDPNISSLIKK